MLIYYIKPKILSYNFRSLKEKLRSQTFVTKTLPKTLRFDDSGSDLKANRSKFWYLKRAKIFPKGTISTYSLAYFLLQMFYFTITENVWVFILQISEFTMSHNNGKLFFHNFMTLWQKIPNFHNVEKGFRIFCKFIKNKT